MTTGAQMMLKNMLGIDIAEIEKEFRTNITAIQETVKRFDERMARMEVMLQLLLDTRVKPEYMLEHNGIKAQNTMPLLKNGNGHHDEAATHYSDN